MACEYRHDFFVSYPHADDENIITEFVEQLGHTIRFLRIGPRMADPVYVDRERLRPGFRWSDALARALCHSRCMIVVYTDDYFAREYCLREWEAMVDLEMKRLGGTAAEAMIIPIILKARNDERGQPILPPKLRALHWVDFRSINSPRAQFKRLKTRKTVQGILERIDDLAARSPNTGIDCESYEMPTVSVVVASSRQDQSDVVWS